MTSTSEQPHTAPTTPWGLSDTWQAIGVVVASVILVIIATGVFLVVVPSDGRGDTTVGATTLAISMLAEATMVAVVWWFAIKRRGASWRDVGFRSPNANRMAIGVPATLLAAFFMMGLFSFVVFELGLRDLDDSVLPPELLAGPLLLVLFATSVIVAPIAEETFFRGFVFGALRSRWGAIRGGAASATLFGLAHPDLFLIVPVTILGALLVLLYVWTDSLWGPIAVHAMFNGLQLLPELVS